MASRSVGLSLPPGPSVPPSAPRRGGAAQPSASPSAPPATRGPPGGGAGQGCVPRGRIRAAPAWAPARGGGARGFLEERGTRLRTSCSERPRPGLELVSECALRPEATHTLLPSPLASGVQSTFLDALREKVKCEPHLPHSENGVPALNLKNAVWA